MSIEDRLHHLSPVKQALLREKLRQKEGKSSRARTELIAFVGANEEVDVDRLRDILHEKLPQYMIPSRIVRLAQMPYTPNGKVDRNALEKIVRNLPGMASSSVKNEEAADAIEMQILEIWRDLLGHDRFSKYDGFFEVGGHSLLAIRMLARVNATLQTSLPIALIVEAPTVARLAQVIRTRAVNSKVPEHKLVALQADGTLPPLYLLPLHMHGALHYRHLIAQMDRSRPVFAFEAFDLRESKRETLSVEALAQVYVDQLLRHQSHGPYYLCGISVAGLLAYEVARMLRARGIHDVEVILLDTYGPGHPQKIARAGQSPQGQTGSDSGAALWHMLSPANIVDWGLASLSKVRAALKKRRSLSDNVREAPPAETPTGDLEQDYALLDEDFINARLGEMSYGYLAQQRPYDGDLNLIRARLETWDNRYDLTLGWQTVVQGRIHVRHVRGDHLGILRRLYVKATAEQMCAILGDCDVRYGNKSPSQSI